MLDIRIFCVVNGDMMIVVDEEVPPTVVTKGGGVQFVVVLIGGNTKLHGIEHEIVCGPSQNVQTMYNVTSGWFTVAFGELTLLSSNLGGMTKGNEKMVEVGIMTSCVNAIPEKWTTPSLSVTSWFGVNPFGRMRSLGRDIQAGISMGLDMPPPTPQHVEVISLPRSHS